jgi:hypothetical protein
MVRLLVLINGWDGHRIAEQIRQGDAVSAKRTHWPLRRSSLQDLLLRTITLHKELGRITGG